MYQHKNDNSRNRNKGKKIYSTQVTDECTLLPFLCFKMEVSATYVSVDRCSFFKGPDATCIGTENYFLSPFSLQTESTEALVLGGCKTGRCLDHSVR